MKKLILCTGTDNRLLFATVAISNLDFWGDYLDPNQWSDTVEIFPEIKSDGFEVRTQREQYKVGFDLVDRCAQGETHVIITHSDHIFNAIRVAIKHKIISHEDVEFRFYVPNHDVVVIHPDADGRIENWPRGFFDLLEEELSQLL